MKVVHDPTLCQLHGQCTIVAPDVFSFGDDDELVVDAEPDESLRADVEAAVDVCPERALRVEA